MNIHVVEMNILFSLGGKDVEAKEVSRPELSFDSRIEEIERFFDQRGSKVYISKQNYTLLQQIANDEQVSIPQALDYIINNYFDKNDLYLINR